MPTSVNFQKVPAYAYRVWTLEVPYAYKCGQGTSLMPTSLDSGVTTSAGAL
jgi:hypothetical protein